MAQSLPPWPGTCHIGGERAPFMQHQGQRVEGSQGLYQTESWRILRRLGDKSTEQALPNDKGAGVVAVDIARIAGVMNLVVLRRHQPPINPRRKMPDPLGMLSQLIEQIDR